MSGYGSVRAFRPTWTEPDPDNPGQRRKRTAETWNWRFFHRGRRYTGGERYPTERKARDAGEKRRSELRAGLETDPRKAGWALLDRVLTAEAELQKVESTKAAHGVILKRLRAFFEHDLLQDITRERLVEYVAHQREKYQDSTIGLDLQRLKYGMELLHERGLVIAIPRFPKMARVHRQQTIPPHELDAILSHLPEHWLRYYLIADEIGWRAQSEIKSRKWTDVDMGLPGWVHLDAAHSKTRVARSFPMTGRLRELLAAQREYVTAVERSTGRIIPWVFCRPDGEPLGDVRRAWQKACEAAGFGKLEGRTGPWSGAKVPHDIRRTALRRFDTTETPLSVKMAVAGHSSTATHAGYLGADPEALQAFAERLDAKRQEASKVTAIKR